MAVDSQVSFTVDGRSVSVDDDASLLEVLRDRLGLRTAKDGCSPQGQCGCCTVLVDGAPRVACVTPVRRVAGRTVVTAAGLPDDERTAWADAFCATGASQCGFCTPGILVRLAALKRKAGTDVESALLAHLCRCTGWRTILEAYAGFGREHPPRDLEAASYRAGIEGGVTQRVGPEVALGGGGFADDTAPLDALVAVADGRGGWAAGETLAEARLVVEEVDVAGPPTSAAPRAAGWAEAVVLLAGARGERAPVRAPSGAVAEAAVTGDGIHVRVDCGRPLDDVVLQSYCIGAAHMGLGWVTSEAVAVDDFGAPQDITIRSIGVVR